jgi:glycosyltransferase A (GT-A) superfamily protein (DUF2064 family)
MSKALLMSKIALIESFNGPVFWFIAPDHTPPEELPSSVTCANYLGKDQGQQSEYASKLVYESTDCKRLIQIYDDTPLLSIALINQAINELKYNSVLLGPSYTGGYYLLGTRQLQPMLYERMVWTSPRLLSETIQRINKHVKTYFLLPPLPPE